MVYRRCVGARACANNCPYKVRRFNWFEHDLPDPLGRQLNPDVVKRTVGVMEKCTFCVQRIWEVKERAKDQGRAVADGEVKPACVQSCPAQALVFGDLEDPASKVFKLSQEKRAYKVLDSHINTQPAISYLERVRYKEE
jgi:molybdopterin-containing oxidoreductase family iron-sulfur binding subunit